MFTHLAQIFDFTFNSFAVVSLLSVLINFSLVILLLNRGVNNEANRWFRLVLIALILWGLSEFLGRISANPEASLFWGYVGRPGWVFIPVIVFGFAMTFVGKGDVLKNRLNQLLIFGPGLVFLFLSWNTNLISNNNLADTIKVPWGWDIVPVAVYFWVFIVWLEAFFVTSVALLTRFYFKASDEIRKKQILFIIVALLIPIIGGSLTDAILPIFGIQVFPIAILLTSVMSIIITYAIIRYRLFVMSPSLTANTIVDTMSEALLVIGPNYTIEQVNKSALDLLGFRSEELVGQNIRRILPDREAWEQFLRRVINPLKGKKFIRDFEVDFRTKDGKRIPVSFSATSLVEKSHLLGIVGLARDVRETKKLINRLIAERNKMSVTLTGIVEGVFAVDKKGKIILFNPAMEKLLEVKQDQAIGKNADDVINMRDKETRVSIKDLIPKEKIYRDQVITTKKNVKIRRRDGSFIYVDLTSSSIPETEEKELGAIITIRDVSKEHEFEEMKLDFVSMAAHELRTPLTSIRGYLSILLEELRNVIGKEDMASLQKAFISSGQLATLVENLLSVSRIERGRMKIERIPVDWSELLSEAVSNFIDQTKQKGVDLKYREPSQKLPKIFIDRFRMSEVISNLVGNAVNYTDSGGSVEVSTELKDDEIVTHVKDTGQGIPEEALPKLFTKFFRVSGVLEQGSKGTGLGLYISKAIVEMHNGRIWAKSTLRKGSTFSFSLPIETEEEVEPGVPSEDQKKQDEKEVVGVAKSAYPQKRTFLRNGRNLSHPT